MLYWLKDWDDPRAVFARFVVQEFDGDMVTALVTAPDNKVATVAFEVPLRYNAIRLFGRLTRLRRGFTIPVLRDLQSHSVQADKVDSREVPGSVVHYGWIDGRPARIVVPEEVAARARMAIERMLAL